MSNEKMSEGGGWTDRLDQLDDLPGTDPTWREGAWEKLYTRLHDKEEKPRRRIGWYWAAAACLVIVGAVSLLPQRPGHPSPSGGNLSSTGPTRPPELTPPPPHDLKEQASVIYAADSPEKQFHKPTPGIITASGDDRMKVAAEAATHPIGPLAKPDPLKEQPVVVAATKQPGVFTDSTVLAATAPPLVPAAKRRLRVVHINELGLPVQDEAPSSHMAGNFFLRIRLSNNDAPGNLLMGSNNEINLNQTFKISFKN